MQLLRPDDAGLLGARYPTMEEVAAAVALAADPANAAVSAQTVAVTNAMQLSEAGTAWLAAVPPLPELHGRHILLFNDGTDAAVNDAAAQLARAGAAVTVVLHSSPAETAPDGVRTLSADGPPLGRLAAALADAGHPPPDTLIFGSPPIAEPAGGLLSASDDHVATFQQQVLIERTALAVAAARLLQPSAEQPRRVIFCSRNSTAPYHAMLRAATGQLVRVWQQEAGSHLIVRQLLCSAGRSAAAGIAWAAAAISPRLPFDVLIPPDDTTGAE
jgi:hypothetical protein